MPGWDKKPHSKLQRQGLVWEHRLLEHAFMRTVQLVGEQIDSENVFIRERNRKFMMIFLIAPLAVTGVYATGRYSGNMVGDLVGCTLLWNVIWGLAYTMVTLKEYVCQRWWAWRGTLTYYPLLRSNYTVRPLPLPRADCRVLFDLVVSVTHPPCDPANEVFYDTLAETTRDLWHWQEAWKGAGYNHCELVCRNTGDSDARRYTPVFMRD